MTTSAFRIFIDLTDDAGRDRVGYLTGAGTCDDPVTQDPAEAATFAGYGDTAAVVHDYLEPVCVGFVIRQVRVEGV